MKRHVFIIAGLCLFLMKGISQEVTISGIANHYLAVVSVITDRVEVTADAELSYFHPGDKVLLIQMTGGEVFDGANFKTAPNKFATTFKQTGYFEILQVDKVFETGGKWYVSFTDNCINDYDNGEKIQLVRFVEGETIKTDGEVRASNWDGSKGGIVAIIGMDSIILDNPIDVSGSGFRGGEVPAEDYTGGCRQDLVYGTTMDTLHFHDYETNRSGNKGEGIVTTSWSYPMGLAFNLNGGGAGNGLFSGGGGGSNNKAGGNGGAQSGVCTPNTLSVAWGGYGCYFLYTDPFRPRMIMGGGGGSGVKNDAISKTASNGGDGGGLVILITGSMKGNGQSISANGISALSATGSGGGGGAGGAILIDATNYIGNVNINIRGGNGGSTGSNCTGAGGSGSGGVFWHSGNSFAASIIDTSSGSPGSGTISCAAHFGAGGGSGVKLKNLISPLNGFLFNTIRGVDTICMGQIPNQLTGSQPKGGDGTYTWKWEQSTDNITWIDASGTKAMRTFQPPALNQTILYRRIINSGSISDTSRVIEVYVYPAITNNIISGTDTLCYSTAGKPITGTIPSGGNNVYQYQWQYSNNGILWNFAGDTNPHNPGILEESRYYRRIVTSTTWCSNTSNTVKITVLPSITNNEFGSSDTVICENFGPGTLKAESPSGGDGLYRYQWQHSSITGSWTVIPGADEAGYNPGILTDTMRYRRIVFSGNGDACKDTSDVKLISVLPLITSNIIDSDSTRYCAGDIPLALQGAIPGGGDNGYSYQWRIKTTGEWSIISGATSADFLPVEKVDENTWFSRIVISGENNACHDTSDVLNLKVVPPITNNLGLPDQTICQFTIPQPLSGSPASGGMGGFTYQWIMLEEGETEWENAPMTSDQMNYAPGALNHSTFFARKAFSDICMQISDTVDVLVYPVISNNVIQGDPVQYTCMNTPADMAGSLPAAGSGSYEYLWQQSGDNTVWLTSQGSIYNEMGHQSAALATRQYFRRIVYSSPSGHECSDTSNTVEIRINPLPTGDVVSDVDTLCAGETLYVRFNVSGIHGPFDVNIDGSLRTGVTNSPDSIAFSPFISDQFTMVSVVDDSGCVADPAAFIGVAKAVVYEVPVANAGLDDDACSLQYTLQASKSVAGSEGFWISPGVTFDDPTLENANASVDGYGDRVLTWTETNWRCTDNDEVRIVFYEQPQVPDAGPDQVLDFTYTTQLQASTPSVGNGSWIMVAGSGNFSNNNQPDAVVNGLEDSNLLRWTVINGSCPAVSDSMMITVSPLEIPKGFTPNGDNKNDYFNLGAVNAEHIRIQIFNSAGVLVYESDNYLEGNLWDGYNMSQVELPEGTYFYIANIRVAGSDKEFQFRSFVEILR